MKHAGGEKDHSGLFLVLAVAVGLLVGEALAVLAVLTHAAHR